MTPPPTVRSLNGPITRTAFPALDSSSPDLAVQRAVVAPGIPDDATLHAWIDTLLATRTGPAALVIRIVDEAESRALNRDYRGKDRSTNVLSFPFDAPPGVPAAETGGLLGDLVVCAPVVAREAAEQGKSLDAHWAHMVTHGVLHLLGYDHEDDDEAQAMEDRERELLAALGFSDPYAIEQDS